MSTSLYAAILALYFIGLSVNVIRARRKLHVPLMDEGNEVMKRAIRVHGNFAEYAPLFLIMLGLAEKNGLPWYALHSLGCLFLLGRLLHSYGLLKAEQYSSNGLSGGKFRARGMACTFTGIGFLALVLLVQYLYFI